MLAAGYQIAYRKGDCLAYQFMPVLPVPSMSAYQRRKVEEFAKGCLALHLVFGMRWEHDGLWCLVKRLNNGN